MLQPIANGIAAEASEKLGTPIKLDVMQPLQAYDAGGKARAAVQVVVLFALAKDAGVDANQALALVNWEN